MFRYMALVWDGANATQNDTALLLARRLQATSREWREAFSGPGMQIFCAGEGRGASEATLLGNDAGVVLGTLFERGDPLDDGPARRPILTPEKSRQIIRSEGRQLIETCWGRYVAFLLDPDSNRRWILKDPTGNLPCVGATFRGVSLFCSCFADLTRLRLLQFTVNWDYVRERIVAGPVYAEGQPLNELTLLRNGECLAIAGERRSQLLYWNPLQVAEKAEPIEDLGRAAELVRAATRSGVRSWASRYAAILHRTSGGLDSSVVLACAHGVPAIPPTTCLTYYTSGTNADASYAIRCARLIAQRAGFELVEHSRTPRMDFRPMLNFQPLAEPVSALASFDTGPFERALAEEKGAQAVFTGDGGDALFGRFSARYSAIEFLDRHGVTPTLLRVAGEVALARDVTIWSVLRETLRDSLGVNRILKMANDRRRHTKLVRTEVLDEAISSRRFHPHPWYHGVGRPSWGVLTQMGTLAQLQTFYDPLRSPEEHGPEYVFPLYAQPLVELCLSIPSYLHNDGGRDRAVVREALAQDLPGEIVNRHWKDRPTGFLEEMVASNKGFIREMLADGLLVNEGLLDRGVLEKNLLQLDTSNCVFGGEFFDVLDVESWLRSWQPQQVRAAA